MDGVDYDGDQEMNVDEDDDDQEMDVDENDDEKEEVALDGERKTRLRSRKSKFIKLFFIL